MIIIQYQDGTTRKLNPCDVKSFYSTTELPRVKGRSEVLTLEHKLQSIPIEIARNCLHTSYVHSVTCYRGSNITYQKHYNGGVPLVQRGVFVPYLTNFKATIVDKVNFKELKKELRRNHKNENFSFKEVYTF